MRHGAGADVMKRIAAPMIGGIVTSGVMELMVFPDQHHWLEGASLDYFNHMLKRYFVEHLEPAGSR